MNAAVTQKNERSYKGTLHYYTSSPQWDSDNLSRPCNGISADCGERGVSDEKTTNRTGAGNESGTKFVPVAVLRQANAPEHTAFHGYVVEFGRSPDWTSLRHPSSASSNGVGGLI